MCSIQGLLTILEIEAAMETVRGQAVRPVAHLEAQEQVAVVVHPLSVNMTKVSLTEYRDLESLYLHRRPDVGQTVGQGHRGTQTF
jgi:hypothetical protein